MIKNVFLGETSYSLSAFIDIPWSASKRVEKSFYILDILDLNDRSIVSYRNGKNTSSSKIFGCMCCKTEPLKAELSTIGKSAFVPGDTISVGIKLHNESGRKLKSLQVVLNRTIIYNLDKDVTKKYLKVLAKWNHKFDKDPGKEFSLNDVKLEVPVKCLPSQESSYRLIQIIYDLRLFVWSTFFTTRSTTILPIKIGNVRLREQVSGDNESSSITNTSENSRPYYDIKTIDHKFLKNLIKV